MSGLNRFYLSDISSASSRNTLGIKCVFISHQKKDAAVCRKIADYLIEAGIDVYFDEYDKDLKEWRQINNPKNVVEAIKKGINRSTHMLCVFSANTLYSKWVPWEIGYGYDKTNLSVLTLKGITDAQLPEYIKTVPIVRGTKTLNEYISEITGNSLQQMINKRVLLSSSTMSHPLDSYLDWSL